MTRYVTTLSAIIVAILVLSTASSAQDNQAPSIDSAHGPRWARVDLTQYCGRTVGELLDTLGYDYLDCFCGGEPLYGVGCTFKYDDGYIKLGPYTYKHIHPNMHDFRLVTPDRGDNPWKIEEFKKEIINSIEVEVSSSKGEMAPSMGAGSSPHKGFRRDFASYIGAPIDSLLSDIGYPIMHSMTLTDLGKYHKCIFEYPNYVTIEASLSRPLPIPKSIKNRNRVTDILLQQRQDYLRIVINTPWREEEHRGVDEVGMPNTYECDDSAGVDGTSPAVEKRQDWTPERNPGYYMRSAVKRHNSKIGELIRRTAEYNNTNRTLCIGTLVIYQRLDDTLTFHYDYEIGGDYYETGVNHNYYGSFTRLVAVVHTHDECAAPTPTDIYGIAHGAFGPMVIIVDTDDNGLSVMRYSDVKTARSYVLYNSQGAIADKCRDPLDSTASCDGRLEMIRRFFDTENTGIDYMHVPDWHEWIK